MARSPAKRAVGTLLLIVAAILVAAFVFLLYARSANDDSVPLSDQVPASALVIAIVLAIIVIALLLMILIRKWDKRAEKAEAGEVFFVPEQEQPRPAPVATTAFQAGVGEVVVYDLAKVPLAKSAWAAPERDGSQHPFYYPRNVAAGVYVNDYVDVAPGRTLKLRTLMAGPDGPYADTSQPRQRAYARPEPVAQSRAAESLIASATRGRQQSVVLAEEPTPEPTAEAEPPADASKDVYYDYPGDNHDIEDIEGIGQVYGTKLRALGVHTTARLAYEDAGALAERMELPRKTVENWKHMAELVKVNGIGPQYAEALVRAGIEGIAELKRRSPARIAEQINAYLDTLDTNVLGTKITEKRVEGWQANAKGLKRVRLQVPPQ
jgi:predicted flap endonuclease-1-like 5' DNA nuclease/membrane protein implicated in regulation of membrane protease activity